MSRSPIPPIPQLPFAKRQGRVINEAIGQVTELSSFDGPDGLLAQRFPTGMSLQNVAPSLRDYWFYGVVVNQGPNGEADYTDARYWVMSVDVIQAARATQADLTKPYVDDYSYNAEWITATHLPDAVSGIHALPTVAPPDDSSPLPAGATLVRVWKLDATKLTTVNPIKGQTGDDANPIFSVELIPTAPLSAIITASSAINGGIRYRYTINFGHRDMTSNASNGGTWVTDSTTGYSAFNEAEDMNTFGSGTGTIGTGNTSVAQSDGTIGSTSCKMKALPVGGYVSVKLRGVDSSGTAYYTITNAMNSSQ